MIAAPRTPEILWYIFKQGNLTATSIARLLGVTERTVFSWETDRKQPDSHNQRFIGFIYSAAKAQGKQLGRDVVQALCSEPAPYARAWLLIIQAAQGAK